MKLRVAVVLNTKCHVETAVSLYFSLLQLPNLTPTIIPLHGDHFGLYSFLDRIKVRWAVPKISSKEFDVAFIVTVYPPGLMDRMIPSSQHELVKGFFGRRILVTHRCQFMEEAYGGEPVISLSPIGSNFGLTYLYQCEIPINAFRIEDQNFEKKIFLVQGRFENGHRNLELLRKALQNLTDQDFEVLCVGRNAHLLNFEDKRIACFSELGEEEFYRMCAFAHFILPLIDAETLNGTYLTERLSSSYGISFSSETPLLVNKSLYDIYPVPSLTYLDDAQFLLEFRRCCEMPIEEYESMIESYATSKIEMRAHNTKILSDVLAL